MRQLKGAKFDIKCYLAARDRTTSNIETLLRVPHISEQSLVSNAVLNSWCCTFFITEHLEKKDSEELEISQEFLETYDDELRAIICERNRILPQVIEYANFISSPEEGKVDEVVLKEDQFEEATKQPG